VEGGDLEVGRVDSDGDGGSRGLVDGKSLNVNNELGSVDLEGRRGTRWATKGEEEEDETFGSSWRRV